MLKRTSAGWVKIFCLFSFALLISAALIPGAGVTPAFAAKKAEYRKSGITMTKALAAMPAFKFKQAVKLIFDSSKY